MEGRQHTTTLPGDGHLLMDHCLAGDDISVDRFYILLFRNNQSKMWRYWEAGDDEGQICLTNTCHSFSSPVQ